MLGRASSAAAALAGAVAVAFAGVLGGPLGIAHLAAQQMPQIRVAPTITASPDSQVMLVIEVSPATAVPPKSFISVRGLPPTVALSEAHAVSPGSWAVPLAGLPELKAVIPAGVSGRSELTISLIAMDGRLLTMARTTLVIQGSSATARKAPGGPAVAPNAGGSSVIERAERPSPAPPAPQRRERALAPDERRRAVAFLKKGQEMFAAGNVSAARLFYERAADVGLAEGALALAATFDPDELARRQVLGGVQPDAAMARRWYERARDLGAPDAEKHLRRLSARER